MMNNKYKTTLAESKRLNNSGLLQKASTTNITADKILYNHAIEMVNSCIYYNVIITITKLYLH